MKDKDLDIQALRKEEKTDEEQTTSANIDTLISSLSKSGHKLTSDKVTLFEKLIKENNLKLRHLKQILPLFRGDASKVQLTKTWTEKAGNNLELDDVREILSSFSDDPFTITFSSSDKELNSNRIQFITE